MKRDEPTHFKNYVPGGYPTPNHTPGPLAPPGGAQLPAAPQQHQHQPQQLQSSSVASTSAGRRSSTSHIASGGAGAAVAQLTRQFVVRRISEGETGRLKEELKCEACGKGYRHITSLAKHLWEHTPEWERTKKFSISKHQQVQLLEAASILVGIQERRRSSSAAATKTPKAVAARRRSSVSAGLPQLPLPLAGERRGSLAAVFDDDEEELPEANEDLYDSRQND